MQFEIKRDILLKSLNFVQGVVEKKNTLPILSNVLLQLKNKKLTIVATDLDVIFYDELDDVKIINEGSTTTSAAILYDILRKISSDSELNFELKSQNKLSLKSDNSDFNLLCLPSDNFPNFDDFLRFWRFLVPTFGFYAKFPPQNRLEMSGRRQEPTKTSIFRF